MRRQLPAEAGCRAPSAEWQRVAQATYPKAMRLRSQWYCRARLRPIKQLHRRVLRRPLRRLRLRLHLHLHLHLHLLLVLPVLQCLWALE